MYTYSKKSKDLLELCHPTLKAIAYRALEYSTVDFTITDTERSMEKQIALMDTGASTTLNSRHLRRPQDSVGVHALDIAAIDPNTKEVTWETKYYKLIAQAFFRAAIEFGVQIEWGGMWANLEDYAHFQLSWREYP